MAQITASLVKELRERTGAGMMDCKKALGENDGDIEAAVDWLRKKGLAAAAKKAGRIASEGLVGLVVKGNAGAVVEVNAETDFVSRNEKFQAFVRTVAGIALDKNGDIEAVKTAAYPGTSHSVADELTDLVATIGENMSLRRAAALKVEQGAIGAYLHNSVADGLGKIAVLVALKGANADKLAPVGKQVAMHVAAANPQSVSRDDLDPALLERERNVLIDQSRASGKPEAIIEKMVEGRLRKYYEEVCLVDQVFVIDGESKVGGVVESAGGSVGGFVRFALGEGLAKRDEDFAAEVAATAGR
ncbi:MAG: translation elongation factor Ts [Rhodospirillales bacterium]|jgi:elongation factor Ts|nr:translation elongation factor Ts [Rhodospirillales bacterium]